MKLLKDSTAMKIAAKSPPVSASMLALRIFVSIAFVTFMASRAALAQPHLYPIGLLPGFFEAQALAISADGSTVVGQCDAGNDFVSGFRWTLAGGTQAIGGPPVGQTYFVSGVNSDGSVVSGVLTSGPGSFRWTAEGNAYQNIGLLPSSIYTYATAMSSDGRTIVGEAGFQFDRPAFRWIAPVRGTQGPGTMQNLGGLPGAAIVQAEPMAVNADGTVIVGQSESANGPRAFRWTINGGMQDLGILPGGVNSIATGVSAGGTVVIGYTEYSQPSSYSAHSFRWTAATGLQDFGLPQGWSFVAANAMNADGTVIGGNAGLNNENIAFLWTSGLGMVNLNTYLPTLGLDLTGWDLNVVRGVSQDGSAVAGTGLFQGQPLAFTVRGLPTACSTACVGDFNCSHTVEIQDVFDFIAAWFAHDPRADINRVNGTNVQDIFDFLAAWLGGC